jgi:hypothetical protein
MTAGCSLDLLGAAHHAHANSDRLAVAIANPCRHGLTCTGGLLTGSAETRAPEDFSASPSPVAGSGVCRAKMG